MLSLTVIWDDTMIATFTSYTYQKIWVKLKDESCLDTICVNKCAFVYADYTLLIFLQKNIDTQAFRETGNTWI